VPASMQFISRLLPHTYALQGLRLILMEGQGLENTLVFNNLLFILVFAGLAMSLGIFLLGKSLVKAQKGNGIGMIV